MAVTPSAFARSLETALLKDGLPDEAALVRRRATWLTARLPTLLPRTVTWQAFLLPEDAAAGRWSHLPSLHPRARTLSRRVVRALEDPTTAGQLLRARAEGQADTTLAATCLLRAAFAVDAGDPSGGSVISGHGWISVADHLGLWRLRYLLEDALLKARDPGQFSAIERIVRGQERTQRQLFADIRAIVRAALDREGLESVRILFRRKNVAGIAEKMRRKGKSINHITDIFAFRLLAGTRRDCYAAREALHRLWRAFPEQESDYIAKPKPNGYRSLHTTVRCLKGIPVEFQIRTDAMDWVAKYGPAAHAAYKASARTR